MQRSDADVVSVDVVDGLAPALDALAGGALVLCGVRAGTAEVARAMRDNLPAHLAPLLRSLVFLDARGEATLL